MSPFLLNLAPEDFAPVAEYIEHDDYQPHLLDDGTDYAHIKKALSAGERGEEVARCASIYNTAQRLEVSGLQELVYRKLKVLALSGETFPSLAMLIVVQDIFNTSKRHLRQFLIEFMADRFTDIMVSESKRLATVMEGNPQLAHAIYERLARRTAASALLTEVNELAGNGPSSAKHGLVKEEEMRDAHEPAANPDEYNARMETEEMLMQEILEKSKAEQ